MVRRAAERCGQAEGRKEPWQSARQNDGAKMVAEPWATIAAGRAGLVQRVFLMTRMRSYFVVRVFRRERRSSGMMSS
jgi:hypothetical protein